jgi:hypothetical protein
MIQSIGNITPLILGVRNMFILIVNDGTIWTNSLFDHRVIRRLISPPTCGLQGEHLLIIVTEIMYTIIMVMLIIDMLMLTIMLILTAILTRTIILTITRNLSTTSQNLLKPLTITLIMATATATISALPVSSYISLAMLLTVRTQPKRRIELTRQTLVW